VLSIQGGIVVKTSYVKNDKDEITHVVETEDDGSISRTHAYQQDSLCRAFFGEKDKCVEITDHHPDGKSDSYVYEQDSLCRVFFGERAERKNSDSDYAAQYPVKREEPTPPQRPSSRSDDDSVSSSDDDYSGSSSSDYDSGSSDYEPSYSSPSRNYAQEREEAERKERHERLFGPLDKIYALSDSELERLSKDIDREERGLAGLCLSAREYLKKEQKDGNFALKMYSNMKGDELKDHFTYFLHRVAKEQLEKIKKEKESEENRLLSLSDSEKLAFIRNNNEITLTQLVSSSLKSEEAVREALQIRPIKINMNDLYKKLDIIEKEKRDAETTSIAKFALAGALSITAIIGAAQLGSKIMHREPQVIQEAPQVIAPEIVQPEAVVEQPQEERTGIENSSNYSEQPAEEVTNWSRPDEPEVTTWTEYHNGYPVRVTRRQYRVRHYRPRDIETIVEEDDDSVETIYEE